MKLANKITNEQWNCIDINDTVVIEGVEYLKVFHFDSLNPVLMRKDIFSQVLTNEHQYTTGMQLNG